jgi:hypothetical protein
LERQSAAQTVEHFLEGGAFRPQPAEQGLAADRHPARDRVDAGIAGMQHRHQQAFHAALRGRSRIEFLKQSVCSFAQHAEDIARGLRDLHRQEGIVLHQKRVPVACERHRHAEDALVLRRMRVRVGDRFKPAAH